MTGAGCAAAPKIITGPWRETLQRLVGGARSHVTLCAPYIAPEGVAAVCDALPATASLGARSLVFTDLSPRAVAQGATDVAAVADLCDSLPGARLMHLPRLHAKVYCFDGVVSVVTSANLTRGGLETNHECGLMVDTPEAATAIETSLREYARLGAEIDRATLDAYRRIAEEVRGAAAAEAAAITRAAAKPLAEALKKAEESLVVARLRSAGGGKAVRGERGAALAVTPLFARTILYLLRQHGPMATPELHAGVQQIHPDLCDDTVNRVIGGKDFGKKWWHMVRNAQQRLKSRDEIERGSDGRWRVRS